MNLVPSASQKIIINNKYIIYKSNKKRRKKKKEKKEKAKKIHLDRKNPRAFAAKTLRESLNWDGSVPCCGIGSASNERNNRSRTAGDVMDASNL